MYLLFPQQEWFLCVSRSFVWTELVSAADCTRPRDISRVSSKKTPSRLWEQNEVWWSKEMRSKQSVERLFVLSPFLLFSFLPQGQRPFGQLCLTSQCGQRTQSLKCEQKRANPRRDETPFAFALVFLAASIHCVRAFYSCNARPPVTSKDFSILCIGKAKKKVGVDADKFNPLFTIFPWVQGIPNKFLSPLPANTPVKTQQTEKRHSIPKAPQQINIPVSHNRSKAHNTKAHWNMMNSGSINGVDCRGYFTTPLDASFALFGRRQLPLCLHSETRFSFAETN